MGAQLLDEVKKVRMGSTLSFLDDKIDFQRSKTRRPRRWRMFVERSIVRTSLAGKWLIFPDSDLL